MNDVLRKHGREIRRVLRNHQYEKDRTGIEIPSMKIHLGGVYTHGVNRHMAVVRALESGDPERLARAQHYVQAIGNKDRSAYIRSADIAEPNLITNEGLNHILDIVFGFGSQVQTWYMGLLHDVTPAAGWTASASLGSAPGNELSEYTFGGNASNRATWDEDAVASQAISNDTTRATFVMTSDITVYGAFMVGGGTAQSKDTQSGTLMSARRFSTSRVLQTTDELLVKYEFTASDQST